MTDAPLYTWGEVMEDAQERMAEALRRSAERSATYEPPRATVCWTCDGLLYRTRRSGRWAWRHAPGMPTDEQVVGRGGEQRPHTLAKAWVARCLEAEASRGGRLRWLCSRCGGWHRLPFGVDRRGIGREGWPYGGNLRPDVCAQLHPVGVLVIEVLYKGPTGPAKVAEYARRRIPWVELRAGDVLADPWRWRPVQAWGLPCDRVAFEEAPPPAER